MNISVTDKAFEYIKSRGGVVTIDPPLRAGWGGSSTGAQVVSRKPGYGMENHYFKHQLDGIEVYTHRDMIQFGPVVELGLGGFWIFKTLYAAGLGSPASCSF